MINIRFAICGGIFSNPAGAKNICKVTSWRNLLFTSITISRCLLSGTRAAPLLTPEKVAQEIRGDQHARRCMTARETGRRLLWWLLRYFGHANVSLLDMYHAMDHGGRPLQKR
jgi:hypothetical protein